MMEILRDGFTCHPKGANVNDQVIRWDVVSSENDYLGRIMIQEKTPSYRFVPGSAATGHGFQGEILEALGKFIKEQNKILEESDT